MAFQVGRRQGFDIFRGCGFHAVVVTDNRFLRRKLPSRHLFLGPSPARVIEVVIETEFLIPTVFDPPYNFRNLSESMDLKLQVLIH